MKTRDTNELVHTVVGLPPIFITGYEAVARVTDSAIGPPPQNQRFSLSNVSWLLDKDKIENKVSTYFPFLCANGYRSMASGCRGTPCFGRYDRELVLKPAISLKKSWGGYPRTTRVTLHLTEKKHVSKAICLARKIIANQSRWGGLMSKT